MIGDARYTLDGRAIDRSAFYSIACDPARSVAVEACAGSGKTWMLVARMLRALLAPVLREGQGTDREVLEPHQILAITFTKKAAGEMRRRLGELLEQCVAAEDAELTELLTERGVDAALARPHLAPVRAACARWLVSGRPVQVRTIHGWFAALLRSAPLSALQSLGLPLDYALLEDDARAVQELWPRYYRALHADPAARQDFSNLVAAHGRQKIRLALEAALSKRLEFALADRQGGVDDAVRHFTAQFPACDGLEAPEDLLWQRGPAHDALMQAARNLGRAGAVTFAQAGVALQAALEARKPAAVVLALLTKELAPRKFSAKVPGIEQVREAQDIVQAMLKARAQHDAWGYHRRMARLVRIMAAQYAELKRERAWVDMQDLERAALHLLGDPVLSGWIQERLDASLRHVLIDEFQDTSPLQWQAMHQWLSSYGGAGGRTPCVFIVGDPKQSIYRFRGAAPKVFAAAQDFMRLALGGALLGCDHTRRNAQAVIDAVNGVMAAQPEADQAQGFRAHSTESKDSGAVLRLALIARPARKERGGGDPDEPGGAGALGAWRDSLTTPRLLPQERLRMLECRQAAAWVAQRLAQGVPARDIMVLARKRDRLVAMEEALRERRIACEQPERIELGQRCEVQDILALVDALLSPGHDLSLARALKSPVFGASDEALVDLALHQRTQQSREDSETRRVSWLDLLCGPNANPADAQWALIGARLRRWKRWLDRLPCHDALVAIYEDGDLMRRFAQACPSASRDAVLANLRALLAASLEMDGGRYATPYALVRRMRRGGVKGAAASAADCVRLLTIHGAKGLEAEHVLVLDCDAPSGGRSRSGVLMDWPVERSAPSKFAFVLDDLQAPGCCAAEFAQEQAARAREEMNALYVAMTRARRSLVLSALESVRVDELSWWTRLEPHAQPYELAPSAEVDAKWTGLDAALEAGSSPCALCFDGADTDAPIVRLLVLPAWRAADFSSDDVLQDMPDSSLSDARKQAEDQAAALGSAMHRLLELWPMGCVAPTPGMLARAAKEFDLDDPMLGSAAAMATRIATGPGAWAWDASQVQWSKNEVEIVHAAHLLRIDRLVQLRETGVWWVLDYKSSSGSLERPELLAQLTLYREAVRQANAGQEVRAAFLGADGGVEVLV